MEKRDKTPKLSPKLYKKRYLPPDDDLEDEDIDPINENSINQYTLMEFYKKDSVFICEFCCTINEKD